MTVKRKLSTLILGHLFFLICAGILLKTQLLIKTNASVCRFFLFFWFVLCRFEIRFYVGVKAFIEFRPKQSFAAGLRSITQ